MFYFAHIQVESNLSLSSTLLSRLHLSIMSNSSRTSCASDTTDEDSVYASTPFKFLVEGNPYYIHAGLVSRHSRPLDRMIHGGMAESQKGFAVLEDVNEGTFARFLEWAYKGYYKAASFEPVIIHSPLPVAPLEEEPELTEGIEEVVEVPDDLPITRLPVTFKEAVHQTGVYMDWGRPQYRRIKIPRPAQTSQELKQSFLQREYTSRCGVISLPPTRANRGSHEDYTKVFLSHARLYVFAEKYDIQP
jgi:hypothetical protein